MAAHEPHQECSSNRRRREPPQRRAPSSAAIAKTKSFAGASPSSAPSATSAGVECIHASVRRGTTGAPHAEPRKMGDHPRNDSPKYTSPHAEMCVISAAWRPCGVPVVGVL